MITKAIELIAEASAKNGMQMGFPNMTHFAMRNINFIGYKKEKDDKYYKAFLAFDPEEVGEIFWKAPTFDLPDIQEAWMSVFAKQIAFDPSDKYVYSTIVDFIHKTICPILAKRCLYNLENDPSKKYILRDYLDLQEYPKTPNEHVFIDKIDGMNALAYDFTKEQFASLIGKTRFEASILLCQWFADAGISIIGEKYGS